MNKKGNTDIRCIKDYYESLPDVSPRSEFRKTVMKLTGCKPKTFWNWMNGKTTPPLLVQRFFSNASGVDIKTLFGEKSREV